MNYDDLVCFDKIEPFGGFKVLREVTKSEPKSATLAAKAKSSSQTLQQSELKNNHTYLKQYLNDISIKKPNGIYYEMSPDKKINYLISYKNGAQYPISGGDVNQIKNDLSPQPGKNFGTYKGNEQKLTSLGFTVSSQDITKMDQKQVEEEMKKEKPFGIMPAIKAIVTSTDLGEDVYKSIGKMEGDSSSGSAGAEVSWLDAHKKQGK